MNLILGAILIVAIDVNEIPLKTFSAANAASETHAIKGGVGLLNLEIGASHAKSSAVAGTKEEREGSYTQAETSSNSVGAGLGILNLGVGISHANSSSIAGSVSAQAETSPVGAGFGILNIGTGTSQAISSSGDSSQSTSIGVGTGFVNAGIGTSHSTSESSSSHSIGSGVGPLSIKLGTTHSKSSGVTSFAVGNQGSDVLNLGVESGYSETPSGITQTKRIIVTKVVESDGYKGGSTQVTTSSFGQGANFVSLGSGGTSTFIETGSGGASSSNSGIVVSNFGSGTHSETVVTSGNDGNQPGASSHSFGVGLDVLGGNQAYTSAVAAAASHAVGPELGLLNLGLGINTQSSGVSVGNSHTGATTTSQATSNSGTGFGVVGLEDRTITSHSESSATSSVGNVIGEYTGTANLVETSSHNVGNGLKTLSIVTSAKDDSGTNSQPNSFGSLKLETIHAQSSDTSKYNEAVSTDASSHSIGVGLGVNTNHSATSSVGSVIGGFIGTSNFVDTSSHIEVGTTNSVASANAYSAVSSQAATSSDSTGALNVKLGTTHAQSSTHINPPGTFSHPSSGELGLVETNIGTTYSKTSATSGVENVIGGYSGTANLEETYVGTKYSGTSNLVETSVGTANTIGGYSGTANLVKTSVGTGNVIGGYSGTANFVETSVGAGNLIGGYSGTANLVGTSTHTTSSAASGVETAVFSHGLSGAASHSSASSHSVGTEIGLANVVLSSSHKTSSV